VLEADYLPELEQGGVGIGFDFFEFIYRRWSREVTTIRRRCA
jgi:hypothetical protein